MLTVTALKISSFTFTAKDVAKDMLPGAIYDVWLYSEAKNKPIAGFGTAFN